MEGKDLRKAGLKVTLPRLKILEILESSQTRHLSAEDIYRSLLESNEDIVWPRCTACSRSSRRRAWSPGTTLKTAWAVFEINHGTHHDHIVCLDCGRVEEFMDSGIEDRQGVGGQEAGVRDPGITP